MAGEQISVRENSRMQELSMKAAFAVEAAKIFMHKDRFIKPPGRMKIGFEMEASLVDGAGLPVSEDVRDAIRNEVPSADPELGAAQIEWRTDPIELNNDGGLRMVIEQAVGRDIHMREAAARHGAHLIRLGTQPLVAVSAVERTNKQKYKEVPDFHNRKRTRTDTVIGPRHEQVNLNDASVVALLNSLQCNLEAESLEDAVDLTNRSLMIGPLMVALSGNARFLEGKDTTFNDVRATAWETSHDTRSNADRRSGKGLRIGLPVDYFTDIKDYFNRVGSHPFILHDTKNALRIGIGLFWQDTRIKIIGDSAVVEFRPVSIQPTVHEDIATMLFYLGRLEWSKLTHEELMPIEEVRERRAMAMMIGINPFLNELPQELERAFSALGHMGVAHDELAPFFDILKQRVINAQTPADVFAERVHSFRGEREDAIKNAIGI